MPEVDTNGDRLAEIGEPDYQKLADILASREEEGYTTLKWGGDTSELTGKVRVKAVSPAAAFVVVAKGIIDFRATGSQTTESSESLRELARLLGTGETVCKEAGDIDLQLVTEQIKSWMNGHSQDAKGLQTPESWKEVIGKAVQRATKKAELLKEWDSAR